MNERDCLTSNSAFYYSYFVEQKTLSGLAAAPDQPSFTWEQLPSDNGHATVRVNWLPAMEAGRPGSHFFAKYRIKGETTWLKSDDVLEDDYVIVRALQPDENYEFVVASVDGKFLTESKVQDVQTIGIGEFAVDESFTQME